MAYTLGSVLKSRRSAKNNSTLKAQNIAEAYSLCFYYSNMFENVSNYKLIEQYDDVIVSFITTCEKIGKTKRLAGVLKTELQNLEKKNLLIPYKKAPVDDNMSFSDSEIHYYYEQDRRVDRKMPSRVAITENLVNIFRIIFVTEAPVFSSIINAVIFSDDENLELKNEITLTNEQKKLVYDISKTQFLVKQVNLSEEEARYILFKSRLEANRSFRNFFEDEFDDTKAAGKCISTIIGVSYSEYKAILRNDGKIKTFGFVDNDGEYDTSLDECIIEQSIYPYFSDLVKPLDCSNAYNLNSFSVKAESIEISIDLLKGKNPVSILFYGKPGAGKTELAKAIGKETNQKIYIFKNEKEVDCNRNMLGRLACLLSMEWKDSVFVVDEADTILKTLERGLFGMITPTITKGTVNKMLENNKDKVIYIINHQDQIDESTRRRFTFSIKFDSMPASTLRSIAESKLSQMSLEDDIKIELLQMLDKYHLSGSSVDNLGKTIESINYTSTSELLRKAEIVMKENALLLNGKTKMRETVKAEYDPKVLNASMNPLKVVEMVQNAAKFAEKNKGTESGIRMLFYGLSGTGKTELARYIAEQLGKPIILKRASDILDKYVGGSEQNIRDAFMEAENSDSILLFDEADTFFYDRDQAQRSWERSQVNEFLTQMEEFSGILICTTNLRNIMDPAMQRRFHMMIEFKPMKFEGIKIMADRYFPAYHLSNNQIESLEDMESVTPGDFGALSSRIRFMNPDDVNSDYILEELKKLQQEKKKQWNKENGESEHKIGFTA
ncbi:AAA family ATPase [Treponema sp. C6A8]|uniref:AAA family ATPase n=1 Tax=Treponema sp. C6A8 TaxID=1410609 RepID=UPI00047F607D|nr:AAA family ATPase [Treponema sp. C6A8]